MGGGKRVKVVNINKTFARNKRGVIDIGTVISAATRTIDLSYLGDVITVLLIIVQLIGADIFLAMYSIFLILNLITLSL